MRINPVRSFSTNKYKNPAHTNPQFKRNEVGKIAGIVAGGAAAVGLALITAPVLVCAGPILGVIGAGAGAKIEESIKKALKSNNK